MEHILNYFRIGEFAKLSQVTKDTLFHYDKIGILKPVFVDELNGYRYYSGAQFFHLEMIKALRESGLSLTEIKDFKEHYNPERYLKIMHRQREVLDEQIHRLVKMRETLDYNIDMTRRTLSKPLDEPKLAWEEEEFFITMKMNIPKEEITPELESQEVSRLLEYCERREIEPLQPIGGIVPYERLIQKQFLGGYTCFKLKEKINDEHVLVKPAGYYLSMYHKDLYLGQDEAYGILLKYMEEHGLVIVGNSYEYEVCGYLTVGSPDEFIVRYSIQVEEAAK